MAIKKTKLKNALNRTKAQTQKLAQQKTKDQKVQAAATAMEKKYKAKVERKVVPYGPGESVLLLGEGNFSFALALVQHHPVTPSLVLATAYDTEAVAYEKYPDAAANVASLLALGARVAFGVDAGDLERTAEVKDRQEGWTKVVWNFPHAGTGEKDQQRNVQLNQALLLRFLRSTAPFLAKGPSRVGDVGKKEKGKGKARANDSGDEAEAEAALDLDYGSDGEYAFDGRAEADEAAEDEPKKGTVLVTLRNAEPYTLWNLPVLMRKPPPPPPITSLAPAQRPRAHSTLPPTQPRYALLRTFNFHGSLYPGYAHRRTLGFQPGVSAEHNEEIDARGGARTVEAELVDDSVFPEEDGTADEREAKREARKAALREEKESKGRRRGNGFKDHRRTAAFRPPAAGEGWGGRTNADILAGAVTSG